MNGEGTVADYKRVITKLKCEQDHLFFTRYFFKQRQNIKFKVNWHHELIADELEKVIKGDTQNLVINVAPGSSKTEITVINLIARGLALNPRARFLHLSYSDDLASLNSSVARDLIKSAEYQALWPLKIGVDTDSKKRWNIEIDGKVAGGVYATSLGGQITGFRAGHMAPGFQGAIVIDDPLKPEDGFSRSKIEAANRKLLTTVQSRKATDKTPMILIMQRIAESDPTGFIKDGNLDGEWKHVVIPSLVDTKFIKENVPKKYWKGVDRTEFDEKKRFSYWPYKEPLQKLLKLERGEGKNADGSRIGKHVFNAQYQQTPVRLGGNLIKGEKLIRYTVAPRFKFRVMYADTAQKTTERNDFSVFELWGYGEDAKIYLLDMIRGRWEAPELQSRAIAFWNKHKGDETPDLRLGSLRELRVEDKSSGTGLIQTIKGSPHFIPVVGVQREKDKLMRVMDALPYIDIGLVCVPQDAPFTADFVAECESFSADMSHDFDDQVDPMLDAVDDMLGGNNLLRTWEKLANEKRGRK